MKKIFIFLTFVFSTISYNLFAMKSEKFEWGKTKIFTFKKNQKVDKIGISPSGDKLYVVFRPPENFPLLVVYDTKTKKKICIKKFDYIEKLHISPNPQHIAIELNANGTSNLLILDATNLKLLKNAKSNSNIMPMTFDTYDIAFSNRGKHIIFKTDEAYNTAQQIMSLSNFETNYLECPGIFFDDAPQEIINIDSSKIVAYKHGKKLNKKVICITNNSFSCRPLTFSPKKKYVAIHSGTSKITICNLHKNTQKISKKLKYPFKQILFSKKEELLLVYHHQHQCFSVLDTQANILVNTKKIRENRKTSLIDCKFAISHNQKYMTIYSHNLHHIELFELPKVFWLIDPILEFCNKFLDMKITTNKF